MSSEVAYPQYSTDRVRLYVYFTRKEGMSQEQFHNYWRTTHSKVWGDLPIVRKNLLRYEQIHFDRDGAKAVNAMGFPVSEYDGLVIFDAVSFEKINEILVSKEYNEIVVPDEEKFLDRKKYIAFPGKVVTVFENDP